MSNGLVTTAYLTLGAAAIFSAVAHVAPIMDDVKGTTRALEAQGFEPVEVGGGVWFGGSEGDFWRTKFTAVNPNGVEVDGYATKGLFKGTTLRFD